MIPVISVDLLSELLEECESDMLYDDDTLHIRIEGIPVNLRMRLEEQIPDLASEE